jgi:hypothetical protein
MDEFFNTIDPFRNLCAYIEGWEIASPSKNPICIHVFHLNQEALANTGKCIYEMEIDSALLSWMQRLKRVFAIDIETFPECGGKLLNHRPVGGVPGILLPVHTPGTCISRPIRISNTGWNQQTGALCFPSARARS